MNIYKQKPINVDVNSSMNLYKQILNVDIDSSTNMYKQILDVNMNIYIYI